MGHSPQTRHVSNSLSVWSFVVCPYGVLFRTLEFCELKYFQLVSEVGSQTTRSELVYFLYVSVSQELHIAIVIIIISDSIVNFPISNCNADLRKCQTWDLKLCLSK